MTPRLPYGITTSVEEGATVYHCPHCSTTISDGGHPEAAKVRKAEMVRHVRFMHGERKP